MSSQVTAGTGGHVWIYCISI